MKATRRLQSRLLKLLCGLAIASQFACEQSSPPTTPGAKSGNPVLLLQGATNVTRVKQMVRYEVQEPYPARQALAKITQHLKKLGYQPMDREFYQKFKVDDLSSSFERGWIESPGAGGVTNATWVAAWIGPEGDSVKYQLSYFGYKQPSPNTSNLSVIIWYYTKEETQQSIALMQDFTIKGPLSSVRLPQTAILLLEVDGKHAALKFLECTPKSAKVQWWLQKQPADNFAPDNAQSGVIELVNKDTQLRPGVFQAHLDSKFTVEFGAVRLMWDPHPPGDQNTLAVPDKYKHRLIEETEIGRVKIKR